MDKCVLEVSDAALVRLSDPAAALAAGALWSARCGTHLPYTSATPPLYLRYISATSPAHLPSISRRCVASVLTQQRCADACLRQPKPPFLRSLLGAFAAYHPSPLLTTPLPSPPSCAACSVR